LHFLQRYKKNPLLSSGFNKLSEKMLQLLFIDEEYVVSFIFRLYFLSVFFNVRYFDTMLDWFLHCAVN